MPTHRTIRHSRLPTMNVRKIRRLLPYLIVLLLAAALGVAFMLVRHIVHTPPELTEASRQLSQTQVEAFEQEVRADSLRYVAERQAHYDSLRQQWRSERQRRREKYAQYRKEDQRRWDSIRSMRPQKYQEPIALNLNTADSAAMIRVPLVGNGRIKQILSYRRQLGGYVSVNQLMEINNMHPSVLQWFSVDADFRPRQLHVNSADFATLCHHPYLSFEQVKEIMAYRRLYGKIKGWNDLSLFKTISPIDIEKLTPYLSFD